MSKAKQFLEYDKEFHKKWNDTVYSVSNSVDKAAEKAADNIESVLKKAAADLLAANNGERDLVATLVSRMCDQADVAIKMRMKDIKQGLKKLK
jgi:hypothetical protein